jgi:hypothetical protein
MSALRVYADFNDLPGPTDGDQRMWLSYWGSLCDLARQRIRLRDGMHVTVYDSSDGDEDMEVDGIVRHNASAADIRFAWYVEINQATFRRVAPPMRELAPTILTCFHCGVHLDGLLTSVEAYARCPRCGGGVLDFLHSSEGDSA